MKFGHLLIMIYIGIIISSCLVILFGSEGYYAFLDAKDHRQVLLDNIHDLKRKNSQLQHKISLLKSNPQVMRILARKLGYFGRQENIILLRGDLSFTNHYEIGKIVKNVHSPHNKDFILRIIGFATGVFIIVLFILLSRRRKYGHHT